MANALLRTLVWVVISLGVFGMAHAETNQTQAQAEAEASRASQTIYVFRHAEKVANKPDPELSEKGRRRAANLAKVLSKASIQRIYATKYQRTQQTAQPLATQLNQSVNTYAAGDSVGLIQAIRAYGQTAVIIGHSNTVPDIVRAAGGDAPELSEKDYGDLFVVQIVGGRVTTLRLFIPAE
ncbi:SixA phosphatase family protein [Pseudidiomarina woesei]|uniref:Histidine phosphatase superfamily (Branch 1) n=1 Tax=Pseudidiomarina woesei TaxID=1381080 RepID=A0A0K6H1L9_9GAMM|nr:phosphoglycerate mutase family protein [Pseudidiomarina woesei]CUA84882.1 Histidine phosphatase superfamily (branch 1) [Pseudidiomarina woesei]